MSEIRFYSADS